MKVVVEKVSYTIPEPLEDGTVVLFPNGYAKDLVRSQEDPTTFELRPATDLDTGAPERNYVLAKRDT